MQFFTLFLSFFFALLGTRLAILLAQSSGVLDYPGEIKIHDRPVPRLGGLGILFGFLAGSVWLLITARVELLAWCAVIAGSLVVAVIGLLDDVRGLKPGQKLGGQALGGILFLFLANAGFGVKLEDPLVAGVLALIALIFTTGMSNSINLLDGMDGMASGTSAMMAFFLGLALHLAGDSGFALLALALAGACQGFLVFNLPPARTFMGDVGSLFLGFVLAALSLRLLFVSHLSFPHLLGLVLILAVPLIDTGFAILRRLISRRQIFGGDRFHLYDCLHRRLGERTWLTLLSMWVLVLLGGVLGLIVFCLPFEVIVFSGVLFIAILCGIAIWAGCLGPLQSVVQSRDLEI